MLVIHPEDRSTEFLRVIYEGAEGVTCLRGKESRKALEKTLFHLKPGETILLLGHGSAEGLFRKEETGYVPYVGRSMAYSLRRHPIIGIWCHANLFAESLRLHGLFTGMVISEMEEARLYGVETTEEELFRENARLAEAFRRVIWEGGSFEKMREALMLSARPDTALTRFNYNSIYAR